MFLCCVRFRKPSEYEFVEEQTPPVTLDSLLVDLRRRIRTQNLRLEQLKTNSAESKIKAKRCVEEGDIIGAKGWITKSRQEDHTRQLEWTRYLGSTQILAALEQAIANLEQSKSISRAGANLSELLLAMPEDMNELMDRVKESMQTVDTHSETLAYQPEQSEIDEEIADLQRVMLLTSMPSLPSGSLKATLTQRIPVLQ